MGRRRRLKPTPRATYTPLQMNAIAHTPPSSNRAQASAHLRAAMYAGTLLLGVVAALPGRGAAAQSATGNDAPTASAAPAAAAPKAGTANPAAADGGIEFSDKPAYSVAGVTDWTAVGGHGSDSTLRTSEELNREALALKAKAGAGSGTANPAALSHRVAGDAAERQGNPLLALREYQQATQLDPSEANYLAWGTELLLHRAVWQAVDVFAKAAAAYPNAAAVTTAQGAALFAGARYDDAATAICRASSLDPSAGEPYRFAGEIAAAAPATSPCIRAMLERFVASHPQDAQANYSVAMLLLKAGTPAGRERAQQLLLNAAALDPKNGGANLQLGILAAATKAYPAAITYYRKAVEADPELSEAHFRLAVALDRSGLPTEAAEEYRRHAELDARNAARVEAERRDVKQFSVATQPPATP